MTPQDRQSIIADLYRPQGFYFTGQEFLRLSAFNAAAGVVLRLGGRFLNDRTGQVEDLHATLTPATDRTVSTVEFQPGRGWLQSLTILASSGTPLEGQVYARVDVLFGSGTIALPLATLTEGFPTASLPIAWPSFGPGRAPMLSGALRVIAGTNIGAGADWRETVPTGARWKLRAAFATLATDATVANRQPQLSVDDGAAIYQTFPSALNLTASSSWIISYVPLGSVVTPSTTRLAVNIPPDLVMPAGHRVGGLTVSLQAGDDWGAPTLLVEEALAL